MIGTAGEPMYMATRFFEWCRMVGADPMSHDVTRWIG